MKVKVLVPFVTFDGKSYQDGDEVDMASSLAKSMMEAGYVVPLRESRRETAMVGPSETRSLT